MFTHGSKMLLYAAALAVGLTSGQPAQAQGFRYYSRTIQTPYYARGYNPYQQFNNQPYTTRKPVYDYNAFANGTTNSFVTQTPQGPVHVTSTTNPYTGEQTSTTYRRDPRTGQILTSKRVVNPRTGVDQASVQTVDPHTGTVQRSSSVQDPRLGSYSVQLSGTDPLTGVPYQSSSTANQFGNTYEYRDPYSGGSRVIVPYRP